MFAIQNKTNSALLQFGKTFNVLIDILIYIYIYIYKSKTEKREFLDPRVTNITPGRHKQKGLNLLFFNFLSSAWTLASW